MRRRHGAQSLVEFALIAPILILLTMAAWDGGSVLREQIVLQGAARDGARVGASAYGTGLANLTCTQPATIKAAVIASAADLPQLGIAIGATPSTLCVTYPDAQSIKVVVQYSHALFTPVLRYVWGNGSGDLVLQAGAVFYMQALTPVPGTIVASTPTPRPTATPTPGPIGVCSPSVTVPALLNNFGYFYTFTTNTSSYIAGNWPPPNGSNGNAQFLIYAGNPFVGPTNPRLAAPPGGALASGSGSQNFLITPASEPAGAYTAYFYNQSGSSIGASSPSLVYGGSGC